MALTTKCGREDKKTRVYRVRQTQNCESKVKFISKIAHNSVSYLISPYPRRTLQDHIERTNQQPTAINNEIILQDKRIAQF